MIHVCKILFQKSFLEVKYESLEDSEEHCSVVCKLFFTVSHLQNVHFHFYGLNSSCSSHPSTMPDHILGGYFLWLSGASRFQTLPSLPVIGCVLWRLSLFPTSPGAWEGLTWSCSWLCTTTLYIISASIGLSVFTITPASTYSSSSSSFSVSPGLLSSCIPATIYSVWPGCTMCIVIVWFFRIVSETYLQIISDSTSGMAIIVIIVVNVRYIIVWYFTVALGNHLQSSSCLIPSLILCHISIILYF